MFRPPWAGACQLFDAPDEQISSMDHVPLPGLGGAPSMHGWAAAKGGSRADVVHLAGHETASAGLVVGASVAAGRPGYGAVSGGDIFLAADGSGVVTVQLHLGAGALSLAGRCRACLVLGPGSGAHGLAICLVALLEAHSALSTARAIRSVHLNSDGLFCRRCDVHFRGWRTIRTRLRLGRMKHVPAAI